MWRIWIDQTWRFVLRWLLPWAVILIVVNAWQTRKMPSNGDAVSLAALDLPLLQGRLPKQLPKKRFVYFFAPWCTVCHATIDNVSRLAAWTHAEPGSFVIVALDWETEQSVKDFMKEHDVTIPVLLGNPATSELFSIAAFPSYYILGDEGKVLGKSVGYSPTVAMWFRFLVS